MTVISPQRIASLLAAAMAWRQWSADPINNLIGEPPKGHGNRTYMGYPYSVAQWELDAVCAAANAIYKEADSPFRIGNSMGELRPGLAPQRELPLKE